jgi:hypothetical protein
MGLEIVVTGARPLDEALARLADPGCQLAMVDGQLVHPSAPPPATWREVRLRTSAGMLTLARREGGVAVLVFGNAGPELVAVQERVAAAFAP